jgi:hypothetical protein
VNSVEDRLRAATRAAAATVPEGSAPPLVLPVPGRRRAAGGRHPRRPTRWLAPIAAAVAVAAVAAGLIVTTWPTSVRLPSPRADESAGYPAGRSADSAASRRTARVLPGRAGK